MKRGKEGVAFLRWIFIKESSFSENYNQGQFKVESRLC